MKKLTKEYTNKSIKELVKLSQTMREDIAKTQLNEKVNPSKDSNVLPKKKKQLAVIMTVLTQKQEMELVQSEKTEKV